MPEATLGVSCSLFDDFGGGSEVVGDRGKTMNNSSLNLTTKTGTVLTYEQVKTRIRVIFLNFATYDDGMKMASDCFPHLKRNDIEQALLEIND